jgi:hypothetical protein
VRGARDSDAGGVNVTTQVTVSTAQLTDGVSFQYHGARDVAVPLPEIGYVMDAGAVTIWLGKPLVPIGDHPENTLPVTVHL